MPPPNVKPDIGPKMQAYIDGNGTHCPFCRSREIVGEETEFGSGDIWQPMSCKKCGKEWQDVYALSFAEHRDATPIKEEEMIGARDFVLREAISALKDIINAASNNQPYSSAELTESFSHIVNEGEKALGDENAI